MASVNRSMESLQDSYSSLSDSLITYAIGTNSTWPYVTIPNWRAVCYHVQSVATTTSTTLSPLVQDPARWVNYSQEHAGFPVSPVVWKLENSRPVPIIEPGEYAVNWQIYIDIDPGKQV
jgi:hypothetical protein